MEKGEKKIETDLTKVIMRKKCNPGLCSFKVKKKWVGWHNKHVILANPKLWTVESNPTTNASLK